MTLSLRESQKDTHHKQRAHHHTHKQGHVCARAWPPIPIQEADAASHVPLPQVVFFILLVTILFFKKNLCVCVLLLLLPCPITPPSAHSPEQPVLGWVPYGSCSCSCFFCFVLFCLLFPAVGRASNACLFQFSLKGRSSLLIHSLSSSSLRHHSVLLLSLILSLTSCWGHFLHACIFLFFFFLFWFV